MEKIYLPDSPSVKAWYVKVQREADEAITEILNSIRPKEEQIFGDTETAPRPEWKHEFHNEQVCYKPGLDPYKSYVRLVQIGFRESVYVLDTHHIHNYGKLRTLLEHPDIWKWFHNGKFDYKHLLWSLDCVTSNIVDFQAALKLLNHPAQNLEYAAQHYLGKQLHKEIRTTDWSVPELSAEQLSYAADDVVVEMDIRIPIVDDLKGRGLWKAFSIECGALAPAGEMELNGSKLDTTRHQQLIDLNIKETGDLRAKIITDLSPYMPQLSLGLEGMHPGLNLKSSKQLLQILQDAGLDIEATNKTELRMKAVDFPITKDILAFKKADKLIDGFGQLPSFIHPVTGRIHADFNGLFTTTLRFSSSHPNLQQIPRCVCKSKDEKGRVVHTCARAWFIPDDGWRYVMADYSAIEMVGAGVVANDSRLIAIFQKKLELARRKRRGEDVSREEERLADPHYVTGGIVTGKDVVLVTKVERQDAKPVNFGFVYGQMPPGFRVFAFVQYGVMFSLERATNTRTAFFSDRGYAGLERWHRNTRYAYKHTGVVTTIAGYQIPLEYNAAYDSFAGPAALNYQVQNPCAAGMKRAMALHYKRLRPWMNKAKRWTGPMMCRTVHDELHDECPAHMEEESRRGMEDDMKMGMDKVFKRDDLVHVEAVSGSSWADKA